MTKVTTPNPYPHPNLNPYHNPEILADIPLAAPIIPLTPLTPSTYLNRGCVAVDMLVQRAQ